MKRNSKNSNHKNNVTKKGASVAHKRAKRSSFDKNRAKDALLASLRAAGVDYTDFKLKDSHDAGRSARCSHTPHKDERVAHGVIKVAKGGFGFLTPEEGAQRDIFIPADKLGGAIDSDEVECVYHCYKDYSGELKTEGRVVKITRKVRKTVVGEVRYESGYRVGRRHYPPTWWLLPDDTKFNLQITLTSLEGAKDGDKVVALLDRDSARGGYINARVTSVLGEATSRGANYEAILLDTGVPTDFEPEVLEHAEAVSAQPISTEGRRDLRGRVIFTMDSAEAKDLDDAVSVRRQGDGWVLSVHIADVSHYVKPKTLLDRAAFARGTSLYFTDKVVPMLPPSLSNGACSLNAGEDKYALSAHITLDSRGEIVSTAVEPTVINSRVKGVYSEINLLLGGEGDSSLKKKYARVLPQLRRMEELYRVLLEKSQRRGALELDIPEATILLGEDGAPVDITVRERGVAERIIEQFMLTANEGVATLLKSRGIPCVYRVHRPPDSEKLEQTLQRCRNMGLESAKIDLERADTHALGKILEQAQEKGILQTVSYGVLRSMSKAEYSDSDDGHYGLGIEHYCHFTSPIRRLSDLATHRIIRQVLLLGSSPMSVRSLASRAAAAATETEQRALLAERRICDLYKTLYMSDRIGEIYEGQVSGVASYGVFVRLPNTVEGLIPAEELPGFFTYDEGELCFRHRGYVIGVGDSVSVRVVSAEISRQRIEFALVIH